MGDAQSTPPRPSPRAVLPLVIGMLLGWFAGKAADAAVLPSLGYWGAFAVGLLVATAVAAGVSLPLYFWLSRRGR
jgi:hypothetical protein